MIMIFRSASAVGNEKLGKELGNSDEEKIDPDPCKSLLNQPKLTKLRRSTWENIA